MNRQISSVQASRLVTGLAAAIAIAAAFACSDSTASSVTGDKNPPTVSLTKGVNSDSVVAFTVGVKDNLGIKSIHVAVSGGLTKIFDTTFTSANTDVSIPFSLLAPASVPRGSAVFVTASAVDGAGNVSRVDTLSLTVGNLAPPDVKITSPASGTFAVVGKSIIVSVSGKSGVRIKSIGLTTTGAVTRADSLLFNTPLRDSLAFQDTVTIPANATPGALLITPFIIDSLGTKTNGPAITITVQTAAQSNSVPTVNFGLTRRVEVTDTIHVEASDQAGITALGYEIRDTTKTLRVIDSITSSGQITSAIKTFTMKLPFTTFPTTIYVQGFARNSNGTRSYAKLANGADRTDTVIVVAGVTRPLPLGGVVADAYYHAGKDRLYLTNIVRNQVEVFNLADSSFRKAVDVGSRPWGITVRPAARNGSVTDTLLIANSGGTDISYVNLNGGATGLEVKRYALPNIIVYGITTVKSTTANGLDFQQRTKFDFSDRPQYIGTTCKDGGAGACGDVILTYTTTPTPGQTSPFDKRNGTIRWENLSRPTIDYQKSHFFYEQAVGQAAGRADTLEIVRYDANTGDSVTLVPYSQTVGTGLAARKFSLVVRLPEIAFRDTTFLRNSGNFQRAIMGEGGALLGSRAMGFDVNPGFQTTALDGNGVAVALQTPVIDKGVTGAAAVSDQVANTFQQVSGVGINFDGSLGGVRGDSTYIFNPNLRLQGLLQTTLSNSGFDFHPLNTGPNSFPLTSRLAFAASAQPNIEIYDTRCYQLVGSIPIRDPIIGPIKAALRPTTGELMLIGVTARGVVVARLPNTFTTSCP
ncbi:MAG: hypothetical protein H0W63_07130 [Gemmatimonadaceae bacterium]|nr:hypothetical protein [Gemmatimonadaceae bacterium]